MSPDPGGGWAGRREYRVYARSKVPQTKFTGDDLPRNDPRWTRRTLSTCTSARQKRPAEPGSYEAWTVSSGKGIGSATSDGTIEMSTSIPRERSASMNIV